MCLIFLLPAWLDTDLGGGSKPEASDETALKESSILRGRGGGSCDRQPNKLMLSDRKQQIEWQLGGYSQPGEEFLNHP